MPTIGLGFDSATRKELELTIFSNSLTTVTKKIDQFKFSSTEYLSSEQYKREFSTSLGLDVNIAPSLCFKTALDISNDLITNQDSEVYILHALDIRKKESAKLNEQLFAIDDMLKSAKLDLEINPDDFCQKYGDSYVSDILYGKEIFIIISHKKNLTKRTSGLGLNLEVPILNTVDINQAVKFLKDLELKNLECKIFIESVGFELSELPPREIKALAEWLQNIKINFGLDHDQPSNTDVGFEVQSYAKVLPQSIVISENIISRTSYFFIYNRCKQALDFYIRFYDNWIGDSEKADEYRVMQDKLESIRQYFHLSLDSIRALTAYKEFGNIINKINDTRLKIDARKVNEVSSEDFKQSISGSLSCSNQRISRPFRMPALPSDVVLNYFYFVIKSPAILQGRLSFEYSSDKAVGYNDATHRITDNLNIDSSSSGIKVPADLKDGIASKYLAFHYEAKKSWRPACIECKDIEEFTVETYVKCKKPYPIDNLPVINPRINLTETPTEPRLVRSLSI